MCSWPSGLYYFTQNLLTSDLMSFWKMIRKERFFEATLGQYGNFLKA